MDKESSKSRSAGKRNRGLLSCFECHRRKQKCNRMQPCNDCAQRGMPHKCEYRIPIRPNQGSNSDEDGQGSSRKGGKKSRLRRIIAGNEVILTPESVDALQNLAAAPAEPNSGGNLAAFLANTEILSPDLRPLLAGGIPPGIDPWFLGGMDPFDSLPHTDGEPLPKKSLICYFLQSLAPWLSSYDDTMTPTSPRVSWFPFTLNNPMLFYATLLGAAVHLDRRQPLCDQRKLLWYKVRTMRLANENLNEPSEGASDQMILVALILLYFNVGGGNQDEYEIHLGGIHQMLKLRGGMHTLGMRGMVKNWLDICYGPWNNDWEYGRVY